MKKEVIIFIESNTTTGAQFFDKAKNNGFHPIMLTKNKDYYQFDNVQMVPVSTLDTENLIEEIVQLSSKFIIAGITSSSDYYVAKAAQLASHFNLPSPNFKAIELVRDKSYQRKYLQKIGLPTPKFLEVFPNSNIKQLLEKFSFPVVVKPTFGSGSVNVKLCEGKEVALLHIESIFNKDTNERGEKILQAVLIEEYIGGEEFSAEIFDGKIVGITQKIVSAPPYFIEVGHNFPHKLQGNIFHLVETSIREIIELFKLSWGALHIEFKIFNDNFYLIEINPRLAGGQIPQLIKIAYNLDLIDLLIKKVSGKIIEMDYHQQSNTAIRFIIPEKEGVLSDFKVIRLSKGLVEFKIYKTKGQLVKKYNDFRDRIGHVITEGISPKEAGCLAENIRLSSLKNLTIEYEKYRQN